MRITAENARLPSVLNALLRMSVGNAPTTCRFPPMETHASPARSKTVSNAHPITSVMFVMGISRFQTLKLNVSPAMLITAFHATPMMCAPSALLDIL